MMGIVFEHCTVIGEANYVSLYSGILQASVMQFFKFATIVFFIIGGFLINHKFTEYTPGEYIKNRLKSTIGPWFFWLNMYVFVNIGSLLYRKYLIYHGDYDMPDHFFKFIGQQYYELILFSSYWFILNFLICICILLLFKRYIYSIYFGMALALISLFYSFNLYHGWVYTSHTTALFGFVFYLWLGVLINKHYNDVNRFIKRKSLWYFIGSTALFFLLGDAETLYLKSLGINDAYNTLRITNVLYSLSFFFLLLKIGPISVINSYLRPRATTFGIYLVHQVILANLLLEVFRPFKIHTEDLTLFNGIYYSISRFLVAYLASMVLVFAIQKTNFRWSIGISK